MQSRKSLIVYFKSPKVLKKLKTYGNLTYYHKKRKYAVLYVDGNKIDHLIGEIKKLHHVRYAEVSRLDDDQFTLDDFADLGKKEETSSLENKADNEESGVSSEKA